MSLASRPRPIAIPAPRPGTSKRPPSPPARVKVNLAVSNWPAATDRPRPDGTDIRRMAPADVEPVARALAQAFEDDPHFRWIVRDDRKRLERLHHGFGLFTRRIWFPQNEGFTHDKHVGGALWMPPGTWHVGLLAQLRLMPGTIRVMRGDSARLLKALNFIEPK